MKRPLFVLALAWICGIILSGFLSMGLAVPLIGALFILLAVELHRRPFDRNHGWAPTFLCFAMAFVGYFRSAQLVEDYHRKMAEVRPFQAFDIVQVSGRLASAFSKTARGWRALVRDPIIRSSGVAHPISGQLEIWKRGEESPSGAAGDRVTVQGRWGRALPAPLAGEFDSRLWNLSRGVVGTIQVFQSSDFVLTETLHPTPYERLIRLRDRWRNQIAAWFIENLPGERGPLVMAMTTGQRADLSEKTQTELLRSGLFHLTAVSGLHVTAMLAAFPWALKLLGVRRKVRGLVGIPLAFALALIVGGHPSVVRATILGVALMFGTFLDRPAQSLNLLGAAALLLLIYDPALLASPAFQLSFFIVAAFSLWGWSEAEGSFGRQFEMFLVQRISPTHMTGWITGRAVLWIVSALWTSAVAVLAAAPLTAYHFQQIAVGGLLGNLLGVPLSIAATTLGMFSLLLAPILPAIATLLAIPMSWLAGILLSWSEMVARLPLASWPFSRPTPFGLALLATAALLLTVRAAPGAAWRSQRRIAALALLALLVWWPILGIERDLRVTFLNVGQGDACLLQFPDGETLLIDAGPPRGSRAGNYSPIAAALLERGVRRLDAVMVSHPEADHFGGLTELAKEIPISAVLCSGDTNTTEDFIVMARSVRSASATLIRTLAGDRIRGFGDSTLTVLNPTLGEVLRQTGSRNERSLVLLLECRGLRALFPGDIGEETELKLAPRLGDGITHLLKAGHHGSRFSSTEVFLRAVRPVVAVICCGENNFGHPHPEAAQRLEQSGAEVYSTLHHGTIEFSWDGTTLRRRFPN